MQDLTRHSLISGVATWRYSTELGREGGRDSSPAWVMGGWPRLWRRPAGGVSDTLHHMHYSRCDFSCILRPISPCYGTRWGCMFVDGFRAWPCMRQPPHGVANFAGSVLVGRQKVPCGIDPSFPSPCVAQRARGAIAGGSQLSSWARVGAHWAGGEEGICRGRDSGTHWVCYQPSAISQLSQYTSSLRLSAPYFAL